MHILASLSTIWSFSMNQCEALAVNNGNLHCLIACSNTNSLKNLFDEFVVNIGYRKEEAKIHLIDTENDMDVFLVLGRHAPEGTNELSRTYYGP